MPWNDENLKKVLQTGGVAVMPTDTIYGLVGSAFDETVVNRIYSLRRRDPEKPCIILIGNIDELKKFSIVLSAEQKKAIENFPPTPISFIVDCPDASFQYLHRGTKTLAFRIPSSAPLRALLLAVGPLVAPSANPEGLPPAQSISKAKKYFDRPTSTGDSVDLYLDGGLITHKASRLIKLHKDGTMNILRA